MLRTARRIFGFSLTFVLLSGALWLPSGRTIAAQELPGELSNETFWQMVVEFSEPGGYFRSDNFVSNETMFQYVIPDLLENANSGVYLGVGPDQNFTYIVGLQPPLAFIIDIRRQNMLQHLLYKAIIELSGDRAEFLSRLFSRPRPEGLDAQSNLRELFEAYDTAERNAELFVENLDAVLNHLTERRGFELSGDDKDSIEFVYRAFFIDGPSLTYSGPGVIGGVRRMPTYAQLMSETDGAGQARSYMATEANFRILQELHKKNLIVPVVGDFAGPKSIRAVGEYLKEHRATVTAIYVSNVEQYLFQQGRDWRTYYSNVATLPLDPTSTFIRAVFNLGGFGYPAQPYGIQSVSLLSSVTDLLRAFEAGQVTHYYDVVLMSR